MSILGILPGAMTTAPPHRLLAYMAGNLTVLGVATLALRDTFVVPLITGNFGATIFHRFWTPLATWMALGLFVAAAGVAGLSVWARRRGFLWGEATPRVAAGSFAAVVLFGALIGTLAAFAR